MPPAIPIIAAVAGSMAASAGAGFALGGTLFGAGILGTMGAAIAFDTVFGAIMGSVVSMGLNTIGGSLLGGKQDGGSGSYDTSMQDLNSGLKTLVRMSDDTMKIIYGRARIGGTLAYIESYASAPDSDGTTQTGDNLFLHMVVMHAGHECDAFEEFYLNDDLVTLDANGFVNEAPYKKDGKSYVRIKTHLGSDTQVADSYLINEATNWTSNHRLRGICYTYIRYQYNGNIFTNGIPTLNVVLRGKKVYDPRTLLTAWSNNAALCQRDYLTSRDVNNIPYGFGATSSEIDDTFTIAAANICDESVTKLDASTIARYTLNGIIDTAQSPLRNIDAMLSASVGTVTQPVGQFRIYAGAYDTPETYVVDESILSGSIKSQNRTPRQQLYNAVRGLYINPSNNWQSDSFPEITSATYEAQDDNERIYTDITLPFTTDPEVAQRIAKIMQRKAREQITVTMPCNYKALQFAVWDNVKVNNTARGWSEKVFRIYGMTFDVAQGVVLQLREENSASYSWTASDAEAVAAAPDTNLPDAFTVAVPATVAYTSRAISTTGGDTVYNLVLTWAASTNAFINSGGQFEVQFRLATETDWRPSFFVDGALSATDIPSTTVNTLYDLRIRAINTLGVKSNWVQLDDALIGTSGGVVYTNDWGLVTETPASFFNDWGNAADAPTTNNDWGSVV